MTKIFSITVIIVLILILGVYYVVDTQEKQATVEGEQPLENAETIEIEEKIHDYSGLQEEINNITAGSEEYSIYVAKPSLGENQLIINNQVRRSASMIKVFIMAYAMDEAAHTKLNLDTRLTLKSSDKVGGAGIIAGWKTGTEISLDELITLMITESDNTATNMLIDYLSMENINDYIRRGGYADTSLQRKMMDTSAVEAGRENYSSVRDLGDFFTKLLSHSCVSYEYDQRMIDILLKQTDTEVFPSALPHVQIAHKTGELNNLYDDGGIIFTDKEPYVVVIMDDDVARGAAVAKMKQILRAVDERI